MGFVQVENRVSTTVHRVSTRESEGTKREAQAVGRDMSCPRKLSLDERSLF